MVRRVRRHFRCIRYFDRMDLLRATLLGEDDDDGGDDDDDDDDRCSIDSVALESLDHSRTSRNRALVT